MIVVLVLAKRSHDLMLFTTPPQHQMEMYGKLHTAFRKVVDVMTTGRRYLGTYFRIAFFGKVGALVTSVLL